MLPVIYISGDQPNLFGVCCPELTLAIEFPIRPTLSSTCSTDLSVLEEFPDDVPVVISLYDLLEALASRNSSCRPHLVLSNDIQPHLRGVPPVLYDLLEALAFRNSSCRFLLVLSNDIQTHLRGVPPVYASIALSPNTFPATSTPGS